MSGSNFDLNPLAGGRTDPNARIYERLAAMELRLAALERRRDIVVWPFVIGSNGGSVEYPYAGGRLWVAMGGDASAGATGGVVGYELRLEGTALNSTIADAPAFANRPVPFTVKENDITLPLGDVTVSAHFYAGGQTAGMSARGLIIEWPQA